MAGRIVWTRDCAGHCRFSKASSRASFSADSASSGTLAYSCALLYTRVRRCVVPLTLPPLALDARDISPTPYDPTAVAFLGARSSCGSQMTRSRVPPETPASAEARAQAVANWHDVTTFEMLLHPDARESGTLNQQLQSGNVFAVWSPERNLYLFPPWQLDPAGRPSRPPGGAGTSARSTRLVRRRSDIRLGGARVADRPPCSAAWEYPIRHAGP